MSLTPEQLAARRHGLGGSEVATILGLNPYKTDYELWLEKTGRREPEDISMKFAIRRGNDMEDLVAKWFCEDTGMTAHRVNKTLTNPDFPYLVGHIDRRIVGVKEGLECKTSNWRMAAKFGEEGSDEVPANYLIQCMHYMIVTGWRVWHLAAELGGDFKIYRIEYDAALANHLAKTADEWWQKHIIADEAPEPKSAHDLDLAYPMSDDGIVIDATPEVVVIHQQLRQAMAAKKEAETLEKALKNQIKSVMGDAATLSYNGRKIATWKSQTRKSFDGKSFSAAYPDLFEQYTKTSEFRVLRVNSSGDE